MEFLHPKGDFAGREGGFIPLFNPIIYRVFNPGTLPKFNIAPEELPSQ